MYPARAVSRALTAAMVAASLLTAACATSPASSTPQIDLARMAAVPAPRSTLVSRPDLRFSVARDMRGASEVTVLVHDMAPGTRVAVATVISSNSPEGPHIAVRRLPLPGEHDAVLDVAVLEHLYVLAVQQDGRGRFCLALAGPACDPAKGGESHAEVLRRLVDARQGALNAAHAAGVPWSVVSMTPAPPPSAGADRVAVRVTAGERPLPGANIHFSRAPHSGCVATSDAHGLATCELVDYHGDDGDDDANVPVVATYPGDVRADRAWVPTTAVVPPREPQALAKGSK